MTMQTIARVAKVMRFDIDLAPKVWTRRNLPRGLSVVLSHDGPAYRLAMARRDVYPSPEEIDVCCRAYNVPEGAEPNRFITQTYLPKTNCRVTIHVVEITWQDLDSPQ